MATGGGLVVARPGLVDLHPLHHAVLEGLESLSCQLAQGSDSRLLRVHRLWSAESRKCLRSCDSLITQWTILIFTKEQRLCHREFLQFLLKMSSSSTPWTGPWCCRCWCRVKHTSPPRRDTELTINRRQALENEYIYYIFISAFDMKKRKMIYPQALNSQVLLKFFCHAPRSTYNNINNLT